MIFLGRNLYAVNVRLALCLAFFALPASGGGLDDFIRSVAGNHPSVMAARAEVAAAEQEQEGTIRQLLPELQITTSSLTRQSLTNKFNQPNHSISIEQKLSLGGRQRAMLDLARTQVLAAQARLEEARLNVALSAVEALQSYMAAEGRVEVGYTTKARLDGFVRLMERRVASQVSPPIDAVLVRSRMVQTQMDLVQAEAARAVAQTRLQQLAGEVMLPDYSEFRASSDALLVRQLLAQRADGVADTAEEHPAVRRSQLDALTAKYRGDMALADQLPYLYARVEKNSYDAPGYAAVSGVTFFYVGIRFSPGAGLAGVSQARAVVERAESARQQAESARREVLTQFYQDYEELSNASKRREAYWGAVDSAKAVSESYERQFIAGRLSWQQTLDAVREQGQVGMALEDARASEWGASYRIRLRTGQYFSEGQP